MEETQQTGIDKLDKRVEELITAYQQLARKTKELEAENATLRANSVTTTAQNETISNRIAILEDDLTLKDLQADDISLKIEEIFKD